MNFSCWKCLGLWKYTTGLVLFRHFKCANVTCFIFKSDARDHVWEHNFSIDRELCWMIVSNHPSVMNTIHCDCWLHACVRTMLQPHAQRPHCSSQGGKHAVLGKRDRASRPNTVSTVCAFECVSVLDPEKKHSRPCWSSLAGVGGRRFDFGL